MIDKTILLKKIADGEDIAEYLFEATKDLKPNQLNAAFAEFNEIVEELHRDGEIEDYQSSGDWAGMKLPINLKIKS